MISLEEAKLYLKVENTDEDDLITQLIDTSKKLCEETLRQNTYSEVLRMAILWLPIFMNTVKQLIIKS